MTDKEIEGAISHHLYGSLEKNIQLTDKQIDLFINSIDTYQGTNSTNKDLKRLVSQLTLQQFLCINDKTFMESPELAILMLVTKDGTPADYKSWLDAHPTVHRISTLSLLKLKFWTEEELLEAPELFNPSVFRKAAVMYYSKDTLRVLNTQWKRRYRYNEDVNSANRILITRIRNNLPTMLDNLFYIFEKTNTTNEEIVKMMKSARLSNFFLGMREIKPLHKLIGAF